MSRLPYPTNQPAKITQKNKSKRTRELMLHDIKTTATLFHGGDMFTCTYHPNTKIPTLCCITNKTEKRTYTAILHAEKEGLARQE
jgi:hypothetical protein